MPRSDLRNRYERCHLTSLKLVIFGGFKTAKRNYHQGPQPHLANDSGLTCISSSFKTTMVSSNVGREIVVRRL